MLKKSSYIKFVVLFPAFCFLLNYTYTQKIVYTQPEREDQRNTNFEVIGKMNGNVLIYKNLSNLHTINVYNQEMELVQKNNLDYLGDRVFNVDFLSYKDFSYLFYQYQKRSIVYCMAVKIDAMGKKISDSILLDTTDVSYAVSNKIYSFLCSEDKQKMMFVKVNSKNEKLHYVTSILFNKDLHLVKKTRVNINMPDRNDFLQEFNVDNEGNLVFLRAWGTQNDNITKLSIVTKKAEEDDCVINDIALPQNTYLDDVKLKVDNLNKKYIVTSFYSKKRRGDVEGMFVHVWDNITSQTTTSALAVFDAEFRNNAKGDASAKMAFNDFFIKNIIVKKDGGFVIAAEAEYTSTRGNPNGFNRWDYLNGSSFWSPADFYVFNNSPFLYSYPWARSGFNSSYNITRYYADNIALMSFDNTGKLLWSNTIYKSQFDDNTDATISFGMYNSGNQLHFLFNQLEKRQNFLTDQSITPDGQLQRNATLKNLDRGYEFLPKFAKQIGSNQIIVPCMYRNYLCFAKIDF